MWNSDLVVVPLDDLTPAKQVQIIERLFVRFNSHYGALWSAQYADETLTAAAKAEWRAALASYSINQIKQAIKACIAAHPDHPPTLGQFVALCRRRHGTWLGASMPAHRKALPAAEPIGREEAIARMRQAVGLPPKPKVDC